MMGLDVRGSRTGQVKLQLFCYGDRPDIAPCGLLSMFHRTQCAQAIASNVAMVVYERSLTLSAHVFHHLLAM